jgi:RnfABCDGE-type electron transport complex B subunit
MNVMMAVVIVSVTGLLGSAILVVASQFFKVEVDERVGQIQEVLPSVNCGACGCAGCADYAAAVVNGAPVNLCIPGGTQTADCVGKIMGVDADDVVQQKAIVACQGTLEHRNRSIYEYKGIQTCSASVSLHGGNSSCPYGCLGYGDCKDACRFGAIEIRDGIARVNMDKCTGCGACKDACPKKVIWIREVSEKPVVMCANHQRGNMTRKACTAGCISCMKCEKSCPENAIKVRNNVARIDLDKCTGCRTCVNECPVKAIAVPKSV